MTTTRELLQRLAADVQVSIPDAGPGIIEKVIPSPYDLSGAGDFVEIFGVDMPAESRRGQVIVSGTVTDSTSKGSTYQHATIEVQILGYVGSQRNVIRRGVLGGATGAIVHQTKEGEAFSRVAVEARKVIDGAANSSVSPSVISASVQIRFFTR